MGSRDRFHDRHMSGGAQDSGTKTGKYIDVEGKFIVSLVDVDLIDTRDHGESLIFKFNVIWSSVPDKIPVGDQRDWFLSFKTKDQERMSRGNINDYARVGFASLWARDNGVLVEVDPAKGNTEWYTDQHNRLAIAEASEGNPLVGVPVGLETILKETKTSRDARKENPSKAPQFFTVMNWSITQEFLVKVQPRQPQPAA